MKILFTVALYIVVMIGCADETTTKKGSAHNSLPAALQDTTVLHALQQFQTKLVENGRANATINLKNEQIQVGDTTIHLKIKVEYQGQKDGRNIFAANFMTSLVTPTGENTEIDNGVIGIGSDHQAAYRNCVQNWMNVFGNSLVNMLQNKNGFTINNTKVYAGLMGIRGQLPANTWLNGDERMARKIFAELGQLVKSNKSRVVPVDIKLLIEKGTVNSGECRVGNIVSFELLKKLKGLPWPKGSEKFIFSQFYLVEKNRL